MAASKLTVAEAQTKTWESREEMEKELKRSSIHLVGADYEPGQNAEGKWCLVDRPLPEEATNVVRLGDAKKKAAAKRPPKATPAKKMATAEEGYKGPAVKGGPNVSRLPDGFVAWAIERASRPAGVSRKELGDQSGQRSVVWFAYMQGIAKSEGLQCHMARSGKYNNFWLHKPGEKPWEH